MSPASLVRYSLLDSPARSSWCSGIWFCRRKQGAKPVLRPDDPYELGVDEGEGDLQKAFILNTWGWRVSITYGPKGVAIFRVEVFIT